MNDELLHTCVLSSVAMCNSSHDPVKQEDHLTGAHMHCFTIFSPFGKSDEMIIGTMSDIIYKCKGRMVMQYE